MPNPHYIARISYNRSHWRRPTRDAQYHEKVGTFNNDNGFGLEDWLFRNEWMISGWRYAFLQGVNDSYNRLIKENEPFDVTLFTLDQPIVRRLYIATIRDVECLQPDQANEAKAIFQKKGWLDIMREEVQRCGARTEGLDKDLRAKHLLNIRFRLPNITFYPPETVIQPDDPVRKFNYYTLNLASKQIEKLNKENARRTRLGIETLISPKEFERRAVAPTLVSPEHAKMQVQLVKELKQEYPGAQIVCEENFVDVTVRTPDETLLFEIKSDLAARTVLRQALGQILEYAYHRPALHAPPARLIIVGRSKLENEDRRYLNHLRNTFGLPLDYRVVTLD